MDAHHAKTEGNHDMMATMKASQEGINALMDVSLQTMEACLEKTEVNWGKSRNQDGSVSGRRGSGNY